MNKEIKEEIKKQIEEYLNKHDSLIITKARNGYKVKCMDWERDDPQMEEILFAVERTDWEVKKYSDKEKKEMSEMIDQILSWLGYDWDKRRGDNPELRWDLEGDHYRENS